MVKTKNLVLLSGGLDSAVAASIITLDNESETYHLSRFHGNCMEEKAVSYLQIFYNPEGAYITKIPSVPSDGFKNYDLLMSRYDGKFVHLFRQGAVILKKLLKEDEEGRIVFGVNANDLIRDKIPRDHFKDVESELKKEDSRISLYTPLVDLTKKDVVGLAKKLGVPIGMTWSCYKDSEIPCGKCDGCALRIFAFRKSKFDDISILSIR